MFLNRDSKVAKRMPSRPPHLPMSCQKDGSVSANIIGNTLTRSEAIEIYTPYDITSSWPRKMTIAFFANFGGIEKLFCAPEQSLNSKIMNQCNIYFNFLE